MRLMNISISSAPVPIVVHWGRTGFDKICNESALIPAMSILDLMYLKLISNDNMP